MQGKRCKDTASISEPGDYAVKLTAENEVISMWAMLPNSCKIYIPAKGHGYGQAEWDITVEEDGTVTVDPSILLSGLGRKLDPEHSIDGWTGDEWHGYLEHGIWREC